MAFRLIPRDEGFYVLFNEAAANAAAAARVLREVLNGLPASAALVDKVVEYERKGDQITRTIFGRLDTAIITPFDREDIQAMTDKLDDAVDDMRSAADLVRLHHVAEPIRGVREMADLIVDAADATVRLFLKLPKLRDLRPELDEIDDLESQGDALHRETTARLFSGHYDAFTVLKWMDIVENMEKTLNRFERTSDMISTIALKHA